MEQLTTGVESARWWSKNTVAVVTGGNKGIGFEIVRQLATQGVTTILSARDESRGLKAVDALKQSGLDAIFHMLDVTNSESIGEFAAWLKQKFGGFDILINNAGIVWSSNSDKVAAAKEVLETNYYGVKKVTEALFPLLRPSSAAARVINISSMAGQLYAVGNSKWRDELANDEKLSEEVIEAFIESYLKDRKEGTDTVLQMPSPIILDLYGNYVASKVSLNALTRLQASTAAIRNKDAKVFLNCMCPGKTATDMTEQQGHSVEAGADTAVWLALLPASECVSGKFFLKRTDRGFLYIEEASSQIPDEIKSQLSAIH